MNIFKQLKSVRGTDKQSGIDKFTDFISQNKEEILTPEVQTFLINNWWSTPFPPCIQNYDARVDKKKFFECIDFSRNFPTSEKFDANGNDMSKKYRKQEISWFQIGLLSHWTFVREGFYYIEDKTQAVSLKNSLGENSLHVMASTLSEMPRHNYQDVLAFIHENADFRINEDFTDFIKQNITLSTHPLIASINQELLEDVGKIILMEKLQSSLDKKHMNKFKKI